VPAQIGAYAVAFILMYLLVTRVHHCRFWTGIKWVWPPGRAAAALIFFVGMPLALGISYLETVLPMPRHVPFERLFDTARAAYIMGVLAVIVAPFMEELFFRGFLYPALRRFGTILAILLTSLTFAGVHGAQYGWAWSAVLLMFVVGIVLTVARAWTGSVAPGFIIHAAYNLTLFVMLYVSTDHFRHLERIVQ
jgi:membrane protease YdiL (CAAX protease family)